MHRDLKETVGKWGLEQYRRCLLRLPSSILLAGEMHVFQRGEMKYQAGSKWRPWLPELQTRHSVQHIPTTHGQFFIAVANTWEKKLEKRIHLSPVVQRPHTSTAWAWASLWGMVQSGSPHGRWEVERGMGVCGEQCTPKNALPVTYFLQLYPTSRRFWNLKGYVTRWNLWGIFHFQAIIFDQVNPDQMWSDLRC